MNSPPKLLIFSVADRGYQETPGAIVDLVPGCWRNYSTGFSLGTSQDGLRLQVGDRAGIFEIGALTLSAVESNTVVLKLAGPKELQSLTCAGDLLPLPGGPHARFFSFGSEPRLVLPIVAAEGVLSLEIWMSWTEDLSLVASLLADAIPGATEHGKPLPPAVAAMKAEILVHQTERNILAVEFQRAKSAGHALRASLQRVEQELNSERTIREQTDLDLAYWKGEAEKMQFNHGRLIEENREREGLAADLNGARERSAAAQVEVERVTEELRLASAELANLRVQCPELERAVQGLRAERDELRRSYSWKITAPFRAALRIARLQG